MVGKTIKKQPRTKYPPVIRLARIWHRRLREQMLTFLLAVQIFSLFIMPSLRASGFPLPHIIVYSVLVVFITLAIILSRSSGAMITMIVSVILTIIGLSWRHEHPDILTDSVSALGQVLTQLSLLWVVATAVFGPGRFTSHRILGAIVMYLAMGMVFTALDTLLAQTITNAYTHLPTDYFDLRESMAYFSFGTLTTGNFGDIIPVHPIARSLANLESICGQLFPATLLARIVGLQGTNNSNKNLL